MTEQPPIYEDYIVKDTYLSNVKPDQTIVFKKGLIPLLPGIRKGLKDLFTPLPVATSRTSDFDEWYPAANSYYPFSEDVDAFARVHHLLATKFSSGSTIRGEGECLNEYGDKRANHRYLRSKPISFLITGKPGLGEEEVGKRLANWWKCVYIDSLTLLEEEIASDSRPGQCIEFNLRCGRAVGIDVLMRLLARRVQHPDVLHRGFVLCGFPLISNDLYEEDPISSESAIFNVREIFEDIFEQAWQTTDVSMNVAVSLVDSSKLASESGNEQITDVADEEVVSDSGIKMSMEWSVENQVCGPTDISTDLDKQLNCVFGLFEDPFFIIYLHGRNPDVVSKRNQYYFDIYSNKTVDMQKIKLFDQMGASNEDLTEDLFGEGTNPFTNNPNLRHLVKHPENFPANVDTQLNRYHNEVVACLDCQILQHEHQLYIKLDCRWFISQMLNLIKLRLKILPLQPVLLPREFSSSAEEAGEGAPPQLREIGGEGSPPPEVAEEEVEEPEEAFLKLRRQDIVSPVFKWVWSDWGTFCPVAMSERVYQKGSSKYAVHFTDRIYFMANENNYRKFLLNPREFLLPPFPKPGSNVLIFGPAVAGKSAVAKCLGYFLNSKVLTPGEMHKEYLAQALLEYQEQVKQGAIAEALEILKQEHLSVSGGKQRDKQPDVQQWENESRDYLTRLKSFLNMKESWSVEMPSSFPLVMEQQVTDETRVSLDEKEWLEKALVSHNFPPNIDKELCEKLLQDRDLFYQYLPPELRHDEEQSRSPSVHDPFVLKYAENKVNEINFDDVKNKVQENIYDMYARSIRAVDDEYYGWVIDGMATDVDLVQRLLEEFPVHEIIVLSAADYNFLIDRFKEGDKTRTHYRDFRQFFNLINERDAAYRVPSFASTDTFKKEMADEILSKVLGRCFDEDVIYEESLLSTLQYQEALEKYQQEIKRIHECLDELNVHTIVIEVDNLTIEELLAAVFYAVEDKYRRRASQFTDADRAEEIQMFMADEIPNAEGEGGGQQSDDLIAKNRRYGDTYYYCPVSFAKNFVLKRGKEEFAAKFKDKVYLCATEDMMKEFIKYPRQNVIQVSPPERYPPPRICVISPNIELRSTVAQKLAKNMGVRFLDFEKIRMAAINMLSHTSLWVDPEGENLPDMLISHWYDILLGTIFFEEPYKYIGFILHGFPVRPACINHMITMNAIPDVIIHLGLSREEHLKRQLAKFMTEWREDAETQRKEDEKINTMILQEWEEKRNARYNELMEINRQNRYSKKREEKNESTFIDEEERELDFASDTQISIDSVIEQQEHDETMRILDEEFPEPVFEEHHEEEELAIEKFTEEIQAKYDKFMDNYEEIKKIAESELIPFVEIDAAQDLARVIRHAYIIGNEIKFRGDNIFERCYDIPLDIAEKLLEVGYYFLSCFGRLCPVQYCEGYNPIHMFVANEQSNTVYPLIHRQHIYFLSGKTNRAKFIKHPLRYTSITSVDFHLIPKRVAVIGPPKSGKSTLANRFSRDLGFRVVSRGQAVRDILANPLCENLINVVEEVLRKGHELTNETIMDCVEAATFCGESVTQGLVYDGFPNSIEEMNVLSKLGLVPHLIFDLQITDEQLHKQAVKPSNKYLHFSRRFFDHLYRQWSDSQALFRKWCDREYQNIYKLNVDRSIWGVWDQAKEVTLSVMFERKHYFKHFKLNWPLRLANMIVTPIEFLERQSQYKTYCPACFYYSRKLTNGGDPPDRTGLVQYGKKFYWLCEDHIEVFLKTPDLFIPPSNLLLPMNLPKLLVMTEPPDHVTENGYCLVCYRENFPKKVLMKGSPEFVVLYKDKYYMFDSANCASTFMASPEHYCGLVIHFKVDNSISRSLEYRDLPVLGMLEQYLAKNIVRAVTSANVNRPVIAGLSIAQSALIFVGLNLKVNNKKTVKLKEYEEGMRRFVERKSNLLKYLELMKAFKNPLVYYQEPDTPPSTEVEVDSDEEDTVKLTKIYSTMI